MSVHDHVAIYRQTILPRLRAQSLIAIAGELCINACTNGREKTLITEYSTEQTLTADAPLAMTRTLQRGEYLIEARRARDRHTPECDRGRGAAPARGSRPASWDNLQAH